MASRIFAAAYHLGGCLGLELELDSAMGLHIDNLQSDEITRLEMAEYANLERRFGDMVRPRTEPCPRYNCHGMTFAGRRTGISSPLTVRQMLHEDRYIEVAKA